MRQYLLFEDKLPPNLLVVISDKISMKIEYIIKCNQNNINGLNNWCKYLDWLKEYISNRSIAFDYANRCSKFPNGAYFLNDFNIGVGYTIKSHKCTRQPYVYIFKLNMRLDEFRLNCQI